MVRTRCAVSAGYKEIPESDSEISEFPSRNWKLGAALEVLRQGASRTISPCTMQQLLPTFVPAAGLRSSFARSRLHRALSRPPRARCWFRWATREC